MRIRSRNESAALPAVRSTGTAVDASSWKGSPAGLIPSLAAPSGSSRFPRGNRILGGVALLFFACLPPDSRADGTPEYLTSEQPVSSDLENAPSATDHLGGKRPVRPFAHPIAPRKLLPELRARIPSTGVPFFDDAVFHAAPRSYYRRRNNGDDALSEAFALGGALGVSSGYFADAVRVAITGYTSQKLYGPEDRDGSGLLRPEQQSYTVLGEAYADIRIHDTTHFTLFRQRVDLPFINADDGRMTPNTFEAYGFRSAVIPHLNVGFGHIRKMKARNGSDFEFMSAEAGADGSTKGVTVTGARYDFSENFYAAAVEEYGWDTFNTLYAETARFIPLGENLSLRTGFQFTDQRSAGDELLGPLETRQFGYNLSLGYRSLIASASYTRTSRDGGILSPWGGSPSYNSMMISDFDRAGEKSIRMGVSCDFSELGLKGLAAATSWTRGNTPDDCPDSDPASSPDQEEFDITVDYRPPIAGLENLWFRVRYAVNDADATLGGVRQNDFRAILNFSFEF